MFSRGVRSSITTPALDRDAQASPPEADRPVERVQRPVALHRVLGRALARPRPGVVRVGLQRGADVRALFVTALHAASRRSPAAEASPSSSSTAWARTSASCFSPSLRGSGARGEELRVVRHDAQTRSTCSSAPMLAIPNSKSFQHLRAGTLPPSSRSPSRASSGRNPHCRRRSPAWRRRGRQPARADLDVVLVCCQHGFEISDRVSEAPDLPIGQAAHAACPQRRRIDAYAELRETCRLLVLPRAMKDSARGRASVSSGAPASSAAPAAVTASRNRPARFSRST